MSTSIDLGGRKALVTGASRGIGREIVLALAEAGADVACVDVAPLDEVCAAIRKLDRKAVALKCDVSNMAEVDATVAKAAEELGGLDILVNNAGITRDNLLIRMKEEEWDRVIAEIGRAHV
jgi:3-oxoacyl-[acyl-carrier protein] reductase